MILLTSNVIIKRRLISKYKRKNLKIASSIITFKSQKKITFKHLFTYFVVLFPN